MVAGCLRCHPIHGESKVVHSEQRKSKKIKENQHEWNQWHFKSLWHLPYQCKTEENYLVDDDDGQVVLGNGNLHRNPARKEMAPIQHFSLH
jgi:hypothetical protein